MFFAGIDTSCYTTSFALVDEKGNVVCDNRKLLYVPPGKKGLRQSEMVFEHIKQFPEVVQFPDDVSEKEQIVAVGYSAKPTGGQASYMPVFMVSRSLAHAMCQTRYALTHQIGHIGAALIGNEMEGQILCCHVSGGTTDVLKACIKNGIVKEVEKIGGTLDISAGQLIDRVGQKLGQPFPCGPYVETLAQNGVAFDMKICVNGLNINLSGAETQLLRSEEAPEAIAASAQKCVAQTLARLMKNAIKHTGISDILMFGGVMCNKYIRDHIKTEIDVCFANKVYASDNACGLADQARLKYLEVENG